MQKPSENQTAFLFLKLSELPNNFNIKSYFLFTFFTSAPMLMVGSVVAGIIHDAVFSLVSTSTAKFFGMKNLA